TWQNITQPFHSNMTETISITMRLQGGGPLNTFLGSTDASGFYTVPAGTMPNGIYNIRSKGPRNISTCNVVTLNGAPQINVEMGIQPAGDANDNDIDNATDFSILK